MWYNVRGVSGWSIELHDEVTAWLMNLGDKEWLLDEGHVDLLCEYGNRLRMPHSGPLGDGLFELRFTMGDGRGGSPTGSSPTGRSCC